MKIGLVLPTTAPVASARAIADVARHAEMLGMDAVWVIDHIAIPRHMASRSLYTPDGTYPSPDPPWEPLSVLAYVAAQTERIRLGTAVLVLPYRHPLTVAKTAATVDALSGGRLDLGVAPGWLAEEFGALGIDGFSDRGAMTDEHIAAMKEAWGSDPCTFHGRFYDFDELNVSPKPVQRPHPPLLVGGISDAALRRAARAEGWLAIALLPAEFAARRRRLDRFAASLGRSPAELQACLTIGIQVTDDDRLADGMPPELQRLAIVGSPTQIAERLADYETAGVDRVIAYVGRFGDLEPSTATIMATLDELASKILPLVPTAC